MHDEVKYWAIIPAAGMGNRMQSDIPKQYFSIMGKKVLEHTLELFCQHAIIHKVIVAIASNDSIWDTLPLSRHEKLDRVDGGIERCHSVLNCLLSLTKVAGDNDWVLVHDAARPCVRVSDIDNLIESLKDDDTGGILALPARDTMKRADETHRVNETVERKGLWHALTPQMFRYKKLITAIQGCLEKEIIVTDEAQAIEFHGGKPFLVEGHQDNIKITHHADLALAEFYLKQQEAGVCV